MVLLQQKPAAGQKERSLEEKPRQYLQVGLFGGEVAVFFAAAVAATVDAAVVLGATGLLLTVVLEVAVVGGFESEVRLSVVFASAT